MTNVSVRDFLSSRTSDKGDPHIGSGQSPMVSEQMLDDIESRVWRAILLHKGTEVAAKWLSPKPDKKEKPSTFDKLNKYSPLVAPIVLVADYKRALKSAPKSIIKRLSK